MCIQFVTHINDYKETKLSKRVMKLINYRITTRLCTEKVKKQYGKIKQHELIAEQTCWRL